MSPLAFADQGRSTPDFIVSSFTLDDAGSISSGGVVQAEDATHIVRIQVQNIGLGAGQASLALLLQGTSSSGDVVLDSTDLGVIAAGASSSVVVFSWAATLGNNQILKARVSSPTDVNTGNNEEQILADVTQYQESSVPVINIPQPAPGGTNVIWSKTVHDFNIGVLNSGVKNQSAQFWLNFTEVANPGNTFSAPSNIVPIVRPGAICNLCAATPQTVSMSFDATTRTGEWNVVGTMFASGLGWSKDVVFLTQTVVFSDYDFTLTAAHDRSVEPGQTSLLNFIIKNVGIASDDYTVTQSDVSGWVSSVTPSSQTPSISPGVTTSVVVGVDVPASAARTDSETVTLTIESNNGAFQKTVSTTVLAGELFEGTVVMDAATQSLTPGQTSTLQVEVQNTGNSATSFLITAGVSTNPLNWDISLSSPTTGILGVSESVTVSISVTPPVIKNPLVLAEYNRAGDAMSVWAQATSIHGGIPSLGATPVSILPVIVVDPGLPTTSIDMTVEQVMQAQQGMGLEEILDLDLEVRHNLVTELSETVDATLTLGAAVFTSDSSGGFNEPNRWAIGLSPTAFPDLSLGQSANAVMTLQGPADDYPVSGSLSIPVTATPTLGSVHQSSGVIPSAITQNLTINIPPILGAVGHNGSVLDAMVGEETAYTIGLANTGNNMTSYRLVMTDSLPSGWVASFSSTSLMPTTTVLSVPADVADHPSNSVDHIKNFSLVITTAPMAPANSVETLTIEVQEIASGAYVSSFDVPIRVGEKVSASLSPTSQEVNMSIGDEITTSVVISNDGNTPAIFGVWLDTSSAGEIEYVLETPTVVTVGAGYESTVRVRLQPTSDALAATEYKATVWVSNIASGLNLSSDILGNISEQHGIMVETENEEYGVVPGESQMVNFTIFNNGNLVEDIIVEATVEGNWTVTPPTQPMTIEVDESLTGSFVVDVPALGGEDNMLNGAIYPVTMRILNATTNEELKVHRFNLIVAPLFIVEVEEWPTTMYYHRSFDRTWDVTITNTGNKDVVVNLTYTLLQGGLATPSTDWEVSNTAPTTLELKRDVPTQLSFVVRSTSTEPALTLAANLIVSLDPADAGVQGSAEYYTDLRMDRFFELSDTPVSPPQDNGPRAYPIVYSHIPTGPENSVAYELELCRADRLLDFAAIEQNESLYEWSFFIRVEDTDYPLDLDNICGSGSLGAESRITLPVRQPWVTTDAIQLFIDAPNPPNILSGDGWDLTFRLYHPTENNGYTVYDQEVFTYTLAVYSDPAIVAQGPTDPDAFFEGKETTYFVEVQNFGTAQALGIAPVLDCNGDVEVISQAEMLGILGSTETHTFTWDVRPAVIDWWEVSKEIQCDVTLTYLYVGDGNNEDNDRSQGVELGQDTVKSWSPDLSVAFIACAVAALLSIVFVRLSSQSEKWQLGGIYAGVLAFGFAFHLFSNIYWGPAVLVLCALWIWRMTWNSSEEFRLIHEDYQRARKGISTVYSDHFEALNDSRRQLTIILCIPVLGMLAIVLGLPPQLMTDQNNLVMMGVYFLVISIGVWYLLKRSDKLYGNLYGRMTDAEVRSIRIERDLSDPARLLNDLADEGLDFSAVLGGQEAEDDEGEDDDGKDYEPIFVGTLGNDDGEVENSA